MAGRGKILMIKPGVNPNSSSIGADMFALMIGPAAVVLIAFTISVMLRLFRRARPDEKK